MAISTIAEMFIQTTGLFPDKHLLYEKQDNTWLGYTGCQLRQAVSDCAFALYLNEVKKGSNVAIIADNSPKWAICDYAIACSGASSVCIHPGLVNHQIEFIINDSGSEIIFLQDNKLYKHLKEIWKRCTQVRQIIILDDTGKPLPDSVIKFGDFQKLGSEYCSQNNCNLSALVEQVKADDPMVIIYTPGSDSDPKGVVLSHKNLLSNMIGTLEAVEVNSNDRLISILPLSHAFERVVGHYTPFYCGCSVYYASNTKAIFQEMKEVKPTIIISVPYFVEKAYEAIQRHLNRSSYFLRSLYAWAFRIGVNYHTLRLANKPIPFMCKNRFNLVSKLFFQKAKDAFGGSMRLIASGGAPLSASISEFFYAIGIPVLEGYGLTETGPVVTCNTMKSIRFGTVGKPIKDVELRIARDGEILTRGPSTMLGYYGDEEATEEAIDKNGWLHTGDIGLIDGDGFLLITDRKKNIIVTSAGKNVAPYPLELALQRSIFIQQAIVIGDNRKFIAALIVPDFQVLSEHLKTQNIILSDPEALVEYNRVTEIIGNEIQGIMKDFSKYEQVKEFALITQPFTIDNSQLTESLKVIRKKILLQYSDVIETIYKPHDLEEQHEI